MMDIPAGSHSVDRLRISLEDMISEWATGGLLYRERVVARMEPDENGGVGVSTCWPKDHGYETALLDAGGAHPVERYVTREAAVMGHDVWVQRAKPGLVITEFGVSGPFGTSDDCEIVLETVS